jgi:hypothetical protein
MPPGTACDSWGISRAVMQIAPAVGEGLGELEGDGLGLWLGLGLWVGLAVRDGVALWVGVGLADGLPLSVGLGLSVGLALRVGLTLCDGLLVCAGPAPLSVTARTTAAFPPVPQVGRCLVLACAAMAGAIVRPETIRYAAATWPMIRPARMMLTGTSSLRC